MQSTRERKEYNQVVSHPFQVFNGIFLTLPLDGIRQTGLRVPLLQEACELGLEESQSPVEILERFFQSQGLSDRDDQVALLFRIIQYVERQVVLVDVLGALHRGPEAIQDMRDTMQGILGSFRPGRNDFLTQLLRGKRVEKILFAATKADHLHPSQHQR